MKKFKAWHLALICVAVFLIFAGIASIIISTNDDYHSANSWNIQWDIEDFYLNIGPGKDYTMDVNESLDISNKSKVQISAISSDINIIQTTGDKLNVHFHGDYRSRNREIKLDIQNVGNTTKIIVKYPKNGVSRSNLVLDIEIPTNYNQNLNVSGVSSDIYLECEDMEFESVNTSNVSGTTNVNTLHAESLTSNTVSGNIKGSLLDGKLKVSGVSSRVNITGLSKEVSVHTVSGDVTLGINKTDNINVDTTSGDIDVTLENDNEFYIKYDSVSGNFKCDLPLTIVKQKGGDFEGYAGSKDAPVLNIDSVSGSFKIIN